MNITGKYTRQLTYWDEATLPHPVYFDVYDVLAAFAVTCPATQHAIKKLLCAGLRGHKDKTKDFEEAIESIERAIEMNHNDSQGGEK